MKILSIRQKAKDTHDPQIYGLYKVYTVVKYHDGEKEREMRTVTRTILPSDKKISDIHDWQLVEALNRIIKKTS